MRGDSEILTCEQTAATLRPPARVRAVVADHDPKHLRALLKRLTNVPGIELDGSATTGDAAIDEIRVAKPDVAVLDTRLSHPDGLAILDAVERDELGTRVVLIAPLDHERHAYDAIVRGARGYLAHDMTTDELVAAIRAAAGEGAVFSHRVHRPLVREIRRQSKSAEPPLDPVTRDIITLTARGLTPAQVGAQLFLAPATVKSRLHSLYKRLDVSSSVAAVAEAVRRGLID